MKKNLFKIQIILFVLFISSFIFSLLQLLGEHNPLKDLGYKPPALTRNERYDSSLLKLSSVSKLVAYCDSMYQDTLGSVSQEHFQRDYTELLSRIIRKRFFHGYSHYSFENNYLAVLFAKATNEGYSAIVIPDDILKYPSGSCSQQSIIMMEVLNKKGIQTRKVGFSGKLAGHFCLEAYYEGGWHFYDTDMEPDKQLLNEHGRPGIAKLAGNKELLLKAYRAYPQELILDVFSAYFYGKANTFPAPRGIFFQKVTKVLSYTLWIFLFVAFIIVRRKYLRSL